jgi:hypothetical protein
MLYKPTNILGLPTSLALNGTKLSHWVGLPDCLSPCTIRYLVASLLAHC